VNSTIRADIIARLRAERERMANRAGGDDEALQTALYRTMECMGAPPVTEHSEAPYLILAAADALLGAGYLDLGILACAAAAIDGELGNLDTSVVDEAIEAVEGMSAAELALAHAAWVDHFGDKAPSLHRWDALVVLRDLLSDDVTAEREGGDE
jgi:hypothetical protein